jgi:hypothetical protein
LTHGNHHPTRKKRNSGHGVVSSQGCATGREQGSEESSRSGAGEESRSQEGAGEGRAQVMFQRTAIATAAGVTTRRASVLGWPACQHDSVTVSFDPKAAKGLSAHEVRMRWPRFSGMCPQCQCRLIKYASAEHYYAGDW